MELAAENFMNMLHNPKVAIVNFGMGNLFSVKHALSFIGLEGVITYSASEIRSAQAVILPGVGAFGDAMKILKRLKLIDVLREAALSPKPFIGICLGMQLLMERSYEFGFHEGLGIIEGEVVRLNGLCEERKNSLKVPQIGWNSINKSRLDWEESRLKGVKEGEYMYFVHSYYIKPKDEEVVLSLSKYGNINFCSSFEHENVFACQFHPERSGPAGLRIYENLRNIISR